MQWVSIVIALAATVVGLVFAGLAVRFFSQEHDAVKEVREKTKVTAGLVAKTCTIAADAAASQAAMATAMLDSGTSPAPGAAEAVKAQAETASAHAATVGEGAKGLAELAKALKDLRKSLQTAFIAALFFLIASAASVGQAATDAASKVAVPANPASTTSTPPAENP